MIYPRLIIPLLAYSQRVLVTEWHVEVKWAWRWMRMWYSIPLGLSAHTIYK
jgi:hypothetical protein